MSSMNIDKLLVFGTQSKASDIHITVGIPPVFRINGKLKSIDMPKLTPQDTEEIVMQLLEMRVKKLLREGEADFPMAFLLLGVLSECIQTKRHLCCSIKICSY